MAGCDNPNCTCGDACTCGDSCTCGAPSTVAVDVRRDGVSFSLLLGAGVGGVVPIVAGLVADIVRDDPSGHMTMHDGGMAASNPWFGDQHYYYGAMAVAIAIGLVHAAWRNRCNSCGGTPFGMGVMWGAMIAMAVGMATTGHS